MDLYCNNCEDNIFDSISHRWRSCQGHEPIRDEIRVVGVEDKTYNADEPFPDVVVAVCQPVREVEEVTHPHRHLKYFMFPIVLRQKNVGMCRPQQQSLLTIVATEGTRGWWCKRRGSGIQRRATLIGRKALRRFDPLPPWGGQLKRGCQIINFITYVNPHCFLF